MPHKQGRRALTGVVVSFVGGCGRIRADSGAIFFVHISDLEDYDPTDDNTPPLAPGDRVGFDAAQDSDWEDVAINVTVLASGGEPS
jgi:hypothetical protein